MKKIQKIVCLIILIATNYNWIWAQGKLPSTELMKLDFTIVAEKKNQLQNKNPNVTDAYTQLIKDADGLLKYKPVSVMQKTATPPSGNKHDYMSIAPYWWPDPSKPDGLPYIRKDGEFNPEIHEYPDKENMPKVCENVYILSLAYYYSNDEKYAQHASKLLEVWFLDSATKMNPNLNFGQAVKGITNGRAEGIIDTRHFVFAIDAALLLKNSKSWTANNDHALKQWFSEFLNWLNTSKIGLDELNAKNNHGVWFDAQTLAMALYVGNSKMADAIVQRAVGRLDKQLNDEGLFPLELERTTSLHYSAFILKAFVTIATLSEQTSVNLWKLETPSGKSMQKALNALLPYLTKEKEWTLGKQIRPFNFNDAPMLLLQAERKLGCKTCNESIKKILGTNYNKSMINLL